MNREIKFRAWDRTKRRMLENVSTGTIKVFGDYKELDSTSDAKDCEFMQYTGLKDKNGKEIYEGDIIKEDVQNEIGSFFQGNLEVYFNSVTGAFRGQDKRDTIHDWSIGKNCEIIGNIYENPTLLIQPKE